MATESSGVSMSGTSPILRGGYGLTQRLHNMFTEQKVQDGELMKKISSKLYPVNHVIYGLHNGVASRPTSFVGSQTRTTLVTKHTSNSYEETRDIQYLRTTITKHQHRLDAMEKSMLRLEEGGSTNTRHIAHVRRKVAQHEIIFQDTISNTQRALQRHADMLIKQQHVAKLLVLERRVENDVMFDTGFLMLSLYIVQTPLVQYTIHIVTSRWISGIHRQRRWVPQVLQFAYIFHIYHFLKYINLKMGFSSRFWGSTQWMSNRVQSFGWKLAKMFTYPATLLSSSPDKSVESPATPSPIHVTGLGSRDAPEGKTTVLNSHHKSESIGLNGLGQATAMNHRGTAAHHRVAAPTADQHATATHHKIKTSLPGATAQTNSVQNTGEHLRNGHASSYFSQ